MSCYIKYGKQSKKDKFSRDFFSKRDDGNQCKQQYTAYLTYLFRRKLEAGYLDDNRLLDKTINACFCQLFFEYKLFG